LSDLCTKGCGGHLFCEMRENGRIAISGEAVLAAVSEVVAEL